MYSRITGLLFVCCGVFMLLRMAETQMSYRISVLRIYPEIFRFKNGQAVVYYKQIGRGKVNALYNGTSIERSCEKIRYIYGDELVINGFWKKCKIPSHHGVFQVRARNGRGARYQSHDMLEF